MSSIVVRHRVADFDTWKAAFDDHRAAREEHGISDDRLLRDEDDANMVTILLSTEDPARARTFLQSDDLAQAMKRGGVASAPDLWIATEA